MPRIFNPDGSSDDVDHINGYLIAGPDIYVTPRSIPLSAGVPKIITGNRPADGGNLILSEDEKNSFIKKYPQDKKFIRQIMGGEEFINNKKRFCLWLVDATPDDIRKNKFIYERVKKVREHRLNSKSLQTQKKSETPHLFYQIAQPTSNYILVPRVSSERRQYIPMDFLSPEIICSDANLMIPDAQIWHFGILTSSVHMAWMRLVAGRLKSDYRYSAKIVYNNFPWVKMEFIDYAQLILAAQEILDIRKKYSNASLADLYDEITMPKDLRNAHRKVDRIVMRIYQLDENLDEEKIQVELLEHYKFVTDYLAEHKMKQLGSNNEEELED